MSHELLWKTPLISQKAWSVTSLIWTASYVYEVTCCFVVSAFFHGWYANVYRLGDKPQCLFQGMTGHQSDIIQQILTHLNFLFNWFHNNNLDLNVYNPKKTTYWLPLKCPHKCKLHAACGCDDSHTTDIFKFGQPRTAKNSGYELYVFHSSEN